MREARARGHEVGVAAWDAGCWLRHARSAHAQWTAAQMQRAAERFEDIFGVAARVHGAPGWQMSAHAYRLTQRLGFDYCADTRGTHPFLPVVDAELIACPQIPTTLPTLAELLTRGATSLGDAAGAMHAHAAATPAPCGHVYTVLAEYEGMKLAPVFEQLLRAWRRDDCALIPLGEYLEAGSAALPRHRVGYALGDSGEAGAAIQESEFLA
jgi:peptidoglycan/xylan/chitin deacetylase (PgdA/CDA1 family)